MSERCNPACSEDSTCEACSIAWSELREQEYLDYYGYRRGPNNTLLGWECEYTDTMSLRGRVSAELKDLQLSIAYQLDGYDDIVLGIRASDCRNFLCVKTSRQGHWLYLMVSWLRLGSILSGHISLEEAFTKPEAQYGKFAIHLVWADSVQDVPMAAKVVPADLVYGVFEKNLNRTLQVDISEMNYWRICEVGRGE